MESVNLDTTRQADLYQRACARMAQLIPGWDDAIASDPAVALLELASFLSDVQNRKINEVRDQHYLAYLKLLGGAPRKLTPAKLLAVPTGRQAACRGRRFFIDGVPFETLDGWQRGGNRVSGAALVQGGRRTVLREDAPLALGQGGPAELEVSFREPLRPDAAVPLWLELQPEPGRIPPDDSVPPPVRLHARAGRGGVWRDAPCQDATCGLLQSGYLTVTPPMEADALRLRLDGEAEGEPRISAVALRPVPLVQRRTRSLCFELPPPYRLPEGFEGSWALRFFVRQDGGWRMAKGFSLRDGCVKGPDGSQVVRVAAAEPDFTAVYPLRELASEEILLEEDGVLPDSLRVMVEEDGVWYDCPVCEPEAGRTLPRGCRWDGGRRILRFGDGRDFSVPRDGQALVCGCACTLGSGGNGANGLLEQDGGASLRALRPSWGGQDAEDGKTAFFRTAREQEELLKAASLADYEALALRTPGLCLDRVRAIPSHASDGAGVTLLAKPRSSRPLPALTQWQASRLSTWMEQFRMVGIPLSVSGPRYCRLEIRVHIRRGGPVAEPELRNAALRYADGVTGPLGFGAEVSYTALFSALGAVPGVAAVRVLELRVLSGEGRRTQEGGLRLPADTLPYLERFQMSEE